MLESLFSIEFCFTLSLFLTPVCLILQFILVFFSFLFKVQCIVITMSINEATFISHCLLCDLWAKLLNSFCFIVVFQLLFCHNQLTFFLFCSMYFCDVLLMNH